MDHAEATPQTDEDGNVAVTNAAGDHWGVDAKWAPALQAALDGKAATSAGLHPTQSAPLCKDCLHLAGTTLCGHPSMPRNLVDGLPAISALDCRRDQSDKYAQRVGFQPCGSAGLMFEHFGRAKAAKQASGITPPALGAPLHGGLFAGITTGKDGVPYALILLPDQPNDTLTFSKALDWAYSLGDDADLPTRVESAMLFANLGDQVMKTWHWTNEQHASNSGYAWYQHFNDGHQNSATARQLSSAPAPSADCPFSPWSFKGPAMDAQALITHAEIEAERRRIARPGVDATFLPFRREMDAILARQRGRAMVKVQPIAAEPHLKRAALERTLFTDTVARTDGTGPAAPASALATLIAFGLGGSALWAALIVHAIARLMGG